MSTYPENNTCEVYLVREVYIDQCVEDPNSPDGHEVGDFSEEEDDEYSCRHTLISMDIYADINPNEPETIFRHFDVTREDIIHNQNSQSLLSRMLLSMHIPPDEVNATMTDIIECSRYSLHTRPHSRAINMVVTLFLQELDDAVFLGSFNSEPPRFVPSSEKSIEALEKVRVEGISKQCTVCLEEILLGAEATRMPCNHVYHGSCIKNWLMTSHLCPLCRFPMPCGSFT